MADEKVLNESELEKAVGGYNGVVVIGKIVVMTKGLNIRLTPSTGATLVGQTNSPDQHSVYEITQNEGYIWYRIGTNKWVASEGTWVRFVQAI